MGNGWVGELAWWRQESFPPSQNEVNLDEEETTLRFGRANLNFHVSFSSSINESPFLLARVGFDGTIHEQKVAKGPYSFPDARFRP
jgi:hypothetical protein